MPTKPRQYSTNVLLTSSSTGTEGQVSFGFAAKHVLLRNDAAASIYFNFGSSVATTGNHELKSSETFQGDIGPADGVGLLTTSTGARVRVTAIGAFV